MPQLIKFSFQSVRAVSAWIRISRGPLRIGINELNIIPERTAKPRVPIRISPVKMNLPFKKYVCTEVMPAPENTQIAITETEYAGSYPCGEWNILQKRFKIILNLFRI